MSTTTIHNSLRAEIYRILSECYKEPCIEFAQDLAEGRLYHELEGKLVRLGVNIPLDGLTISASGAERREGEVLSDKRGGGGLMISSDRDKAVDLLQSLKEMFYPLFIGPSPSLVLPVESVYKVWDQGGNGLVSSEVRGMLMGDPAIDMLKRYRYAGMEIPAIYKDVPDHLALLLEYMALLCESEAEEKQQTEFIENHLDWLPELNRLIYSFTEQSRGSFAGQFYRTVADVTVAFVIHERETCLIRNGI